jgi:glycosyltransferase involved in cell wall biosynthesis
MKVLMLHNRYRQYGGEDAAVQAEIQMLRSNGVNVFEASFNNDSDAHHPWIDTAHLVLASDWSGRSYREVTRLCEKYTPDVAHVHNFWLRLSPSVHAACQATGVPTVQTLHNYRLLCTNAQLVRNGRVCEDCLGRVPWRGVIRGCYDGSYLRSAATARMMLVNRRRKTWQRDVNAFVVMSQHARSKFVAGGFPAERVFIKPNFVEGPKESPPPSASNLILYVGRLSPEKGLSHLLSAWAAAKLYEHGRLFIVGDGPDRRSLELQAKALAFTESAVSFLGWKEPSEVGGILAAARVLVLPSIGYEGGGCPMTVVEAFAYGRPVVVSDIGGMREIVLQGKNGLKTPAGNQAALAEALRAVLTDHALADRMGEGAKAQYLARHTPEHNYAVLTAIYRFAIDGSLPHTESGHKISIPSL